MPPQAAALPNCGAVDTHGPRPTTAAYVARRRRSESERAATTIGRRRKGSARRLLAPPRRADRASADADRRSAAVAEHVGVGALEAHAGAEPERAPPAG